MLKKSLLTLVLIGVCVAIVAFSALLLRKSSSSQILVSGACKDFNVLLITIDTVRADHLPAYGYNAVRAPNLDRLAAESLVFEDAIAHVPLTLPSHVSIMTGRLPIATGVRDNAGFVLDQKEITLAEVFKKEGYSTSAFVSASVLESRWGINQGFDSYDDHFKTAVAIESLSGEVERRAAETETVSERWLEDHRGEKFFMWVHFYDPHDPYDPPEPYKTEYSGRPYDGEIAYVDEAIGKLLGKLQALQLKERTLVIVTADHGEGLGEHNEPTHGVFLYNTTQHVPLMIYIPGSKSNRVAGSISHIDLAPTILELLAFENVPEMQGKSLIAKINGKEEGVRVVYSESLYAQLHYGWSSLESITTDDYRFVRAPRAELYDRRADRAETKNLVQEKASVGKVLDTKLSDILGQYSSANLPGPQKMDPETEEKLRALGYIGTTAISTEESRKIDPKDKAEVMIQIQEASSLIRRKMHADALQRVLPILKSDPGIVDAHYIAGEAYLRLGDFDQAIIELRKTLELQPEDMRAMYNLGYAFDLKGQSTDAEFWFLKALQLNPDNVFATLKLAHLYRRMKQPEKSKQYFAESAGYYQEALENVKEEQTRASLHSILGEIHTGSGNIEAAKQNYAEAIELAKKNESINGDCFFRLGLLYHASGEYAQELTMFRDMIQYRPSDPRGYFYLAKLLLDRKGDLNEVILLSQKGLSLNPPPELQIFGHYLLGNAYNLTGRVEESRREFMLAEQLEKSLSAKFSPAER